LFKIKNNSTLIHLKKNTTTHLKQKMNIREDITCKHCNEIFVDPVTLSCCGDSVCKKHINELFSNTPAQCPICAEVLPWEMKFCINKALKSLIDRELHKISIDSDYQTVFNSFKLKIQSIQSANSDSERSICEKYAELRKQVSLDKESAKTQIDTLTQGIMSSLAEHENESKTSLTNSTQLIASMNSELIEYEKFLKSLSTTDFERKARSTVIQDAINIFEAEINQNKAVSLAEKSIIYEPMKQSVCDIFGKLIAIDQAKHDEIQHINEFEFNGVEVKAEPVPQCQTIQVFNSSQALQASVVRPVVQEKPPTKGEPIRIDNLPALTLQEELRLSIRFQNLRREWQEASRGTISVELIRLSEHLIRDFMELKTRYYKIPMYERKTMRLVCKFCDLHFGNYLFSSHCVQCKENENGLRRNMHLLDMENCSFCKRPFKYKLDKVKIRLRHYASCIKKLYGFH
jgi:hypothetical protein